MMKPVTRIFECARGAWNCLSRRVDDREVFLTGFLTLKARRKDSPEPITLMTNRMSRRRVRFLTPGTLTRGEVLEVELPIGPGHRITARARVHEVGPTAHGQMGLLELGVGQGTQELLASFLSHKKAS